MKRHLSDMHMAGSVSHPHLHSFLHRTHEGPITNSRITNHFTLVSLAITCLFGCLIAGYLIMFNTYQMTGVWPLFGR